MGSLPMTAREWAWKFEGVRRSVERESRIIAACFALAAFCVAMVAGLGAGNPPLTILFNSIIAMVVCHLVGTAAGALLAYAARLHVEAQKGQASITGAEGAAAGEPTSARESGGRHV
jgi:hypothetical protein